MFFLLGPQGWLAGSPGSFVMVFCTAPFASNIPSGDKKVRQKSELKGLRGLFQPK